MSSSITSVLVFAAVSAAIYVVLFLRYRYAARLDARLSDMRGASLTAKDSQPPLVNGAPNRFAHFGWVRVLNHLLPERAEDRESYKRRLEQAGILESTGLSTLFAVKLLVMVVPPLVGMAVGLAGWLPLIDALLWGCVSGLLAMIGPEIWLKAAIAKRHVRLRRSLPDCIDLMVVCLDSGLSLQGAIQRVADELDIAHPDLARELRAVQQDVELGTSVHNALRRFADRSASEEVRTLSTFVREAQKYGTRISDALRVHAESLRVQREYAAEEMAQKAAVKMLLPTMLLIFPAVFVVLVGPAAIRIHEAFSQ